ncbi:hypothetical protein [Actinoplanes sp. NPDC049118]|uniref:hypothetical protein n=1 Tax=Actinoplanes sp. NPDC049118 TaxID=3155769 RepID=UPI00340A0A8B
MHLDTILGLITEREAAGRRTADQIRAEITTLASELTRIDADLADLATTRGTLRALAATEFTAEDPTVISSAYQQILAAHEPSPGRSGPVFDRDAPRRSARPAHHSPA